AHIDLSAESRCKYYSAGCGCDDATGDYVVLKSMEYRMNIRALQQSIQGEVLDKSSPGYEAVLAALLWNQFRSNRSPDVIVRVKQYQAVVQAVRFADANGLRVVARGGGHSWCGPAVRQGGMVIDLEGLSEVSVYRAARRAAIQPFISN